MFLSTHATAATPAKRMQRRGRMFYYYYHSTHQRRVPGNSRIRALRHVVVVALQAVATDHAQHLRELQGVNERPAVHGHGP